MGNAFKILLGTSEGNRPLITLTHRCEKNIKMGHTEIMWESVDCISVAQVRDWWRALVNAVINLGLP
jgi:hypothetical protein